MEVLYELQDQLKKQIFETVQKKKETNNPMFQSYYSGVITTLNELVDEIENRLMTLTI